ncbi:metallophosphoesterase [bacterium]|nr:metallophosphoesterase [bacterium]MCB2179241.1 metallophosphoesterase [bacterium]
MEKELPEKTISRRGFLNLSTKVVATGLLASLGLLEYVVFESVWFKLNRMMLALEGLPAAFEGYVIAHLTDLHFNRWITPQRFEEVVGMVNAQNPDVIAITGDFIDNLTRQDQLAEIVAQLRRLQAKDGVFAVLGNHDYWRDAGLVRQMLAEAGIRELPNRATAVQREGESLYLCGLDDVMENKHDLPALLADFPEDGFGVLLAHEPDIADQSGPTGRFALQLSGHSHGGQVSVPFIGPPITPAFGQKYPRGIYQVAGMTLYTNSGIGMIPPLVRFNCRPEVAVFTLTGAGARG